MANSKNTGRCKARKTPCPSDKICNPASGRCVLRDGAIGKKLLGSTSAGSTKQQQTRQKWVPLTLDEIKRQLPKKPVTSYSETSAYGKKHGWMNSGGFFTGIDEGNYMRMFRFGPHLTLLDENIAKDLIGQRVSVIWGQGHGHGDPMARIEPLVIHKILKGAESETGQPTLDVTILEHGKPYRTSEYFTTQGFGHFVTGGGADPVYVFVKKEGERLKPAPTANIRTWRP